VPLILISDLITISPDDLAFLRDDSFDDRSAKRGWENERKRKKKGKEKRHVKNARVHRTFVIYSCPPYHNVVKDGVKENFFQLIKHQLDAGKM
jgi:hypothetical protein